VAVERPGVLVELLGQPDRGRRRIGDSVNEALAWPDADKAWFSVAWAKRSGLLRLETNIRALRRRRKSVRALMGIDQHGATEEGLELALELFSETRVYHDSSPSRTFHPKFYVVEGAGRARAIVGSGNLTVGGLYENYEVAVGLELDLTEAEDVAVLDDLRAWWDQRWDEPGASVKLSKRTIERLIADPNIAVVPEAWGPPRRAGKSRPGKQGGSVFGPPVRGLGAAPPAPRRPATAVPPIDESDGVVTARARPTVPTTTRGDSRRVLAAGLPRDRWGQAGFNAEVADDFFDVRANGDLISAEGVDRNGRSTGNATRRLIFPATSNQNHRIELPEPEGRTRPSVGTPIVLALELDQRQFRYMYLMPGDPGYQTIEREIANRPAVGRNRLPSTKRVYMTLGDLRQAWSGSPLLALPMP
jgi:HKD family nuclease